MYDESRLEEDVLTWVNSFKITEVFVHSFSDLSNGVTLFKLLNDVDDDIWNIRELVINDLDQTKFKLKNLANIFEGLVCFYDEHLDIMVPETFIDIESIAEIDTISNGKWKFNFYNIVFKFLLKYSSNFY